MSKKQTQGPNAKVSFVFPLVGRRVQKSLRRVPVLLGKMHGEGRDWAISPEEKFQMGLQ